MQGFALHEFVVAVKQATRESAAGWFELSWKSSDIAGPPFDLLKLLNDNYMVVSLEMTSEGRRRP